MDNEINKLSDNAINKLDGVLSRLVVNKIVEKLSFTHENLNKDITSLKGIIGDEIRNIKGNQLEIEAKVENLAAEIKYKKENDITSFKEISQDLNLLKADSERVNLFCEKVNSLKTLVWFSIILNVVTLGFLIIK